MQKTISFIYPVVENHLKVKDQQPNQQNSKTFFINESIYDLILVNMVVSLL